jgi:hypothetical protein
MHKQRLVQWRRADVPPGKLRLGTFAATLDWMPVSQADLSGYVYRDL